MKKSNEYPNPLDNIKKLSGVKQEEHKNIVDATLKIMKVKEEETNDLERLMLEAKSRVKNVRDYANLIDHEIKASGKDHNRQQLAEEVFKKYLDNFSHYNKDELLILLTRFLSELTLKEIV